MANKFNIEKVFAHSKLMSTSDYLSRPEFERTSTLFDGSFISRGAIPGRSFCFLALAIEADSAKAKLPVGAAGKIV